MPAKKQACPPPIRLEVGVIKCVHGTRKLLEALPAALLKEHLRARKIPIPKDKDQMVDRLLVELGKSGAVLNAVIR